MFSEELLHLFSNTCFDNEIKFSAIESQILYNTLISDTNIAYHLSLVIVLFIHSAKADREMMMVRISYFLPVSSSKYDTSSSNFWLFKSPVP